MRIINKQGETITDYDLSKGMLIEANVVREDATPIDNATKWAWDDSDYESVKMFVENLDEETTDESPQEDKELSSIKADLKEMKDDLNYLVNAIKKLI